ncbi:xanthine dehydrogenase/oxidase-like [Saccostrea echinata]|uniref:xanthine dehydrogenase/oxidase-like n=1 Tax=Saccostrea echinata TaxID=191078 RepID=UPI002A83EBCA|nr:xanthine dehydrogenase/oxidase-like [Saccostrea echinata]
MGKLTFFVNGKKIEVNGNDLEYGTTLLFYLRNRLHLTGSKNACGQGECGACSVILSNFDHHLQKIRHMTVNACITPLYYLHGCAVTTVEGIGTPRDGLHPVQESLVKSHGIQCGFCTPGMVVSLSCLLRNNPTPTKYDVERAIEGNLCRCTGYRPILDSMKPFVDCPLGENCCKLETKKLEGDENISEYKTIDSTQTVIFPPELKKWKPPNNKLLLSFGLTTWIVPFSMEHLKTAWTENPTARFVAGVTALGKLIKGSEERSSCFISCHQVGDLQKMSISDTGIDVRAAVTFSAMEEFFTKAKETIKETNRLQILQSFLDCIRWLATDQIRNVATIGGHLACQGNNLDMIPLLVALDATVNLMDITGTIHKMTVEKYLSDEQRVKELILDIHIPFQSEFQSVMFYKQPKRRGYNGIGVSCAVVLGITQEGIVRHFTACFGGFTQHLVKVVLSDDLFDAERTWKSLSFANLECLLRKGFTEEEVDVKEELLLLSLGFMNKVQTSIDAQTKEERLPIQTQPEPCRSNIVFDSAPTEQPQSDPVWRPIPQTTAEDLVSGQAMFIDDMPAFQNELYLCLVLSKMARAELVSVDWSGARDSPGVVDCIDHTSVPGSNMWGMIVSDEELFASKEVVYWGQPVGAVIAKTREQAELGAQKVRIKYQEMRPILSIEDAINSDSFFDATISRCRGDVSKGFTDSDQLLEGSICTGAQEQFYMETIGAIGVPKREQHELEMFVTHQSPAFIQKSIAATLGIPINRVIVRHKRTGGGFGGKETQPVKICAPVALAAQRNCCPVRGILTRKEDLTITGKRHPYLFKYKVGFCKGGKIESLHVKVYSDAGCAQDLSLEVLECTVDHLEGCYSIPNVQIEGRLCRTNTISNTSCRGFGVPQAYVAMETIIDHIAHALNMPAKQVQEVNFAKTGFVPFTKLPVEDTTMLKAWHQCQEQAQYAKKEAEVAAFNAKCKHRKRGLAMMAVRFKIGFDLPFLNQGNALIHVYLDGSVSLSHGGCEMGQGLNMKLLQIASRALGIPLSKIYTAENSTQTVANANSTMGSCTTDMMGAAVLNACKELLDRLQPFKEKKPDATWEAIVMDAYVNRISLSVVGHGSPGDGGILYYTFGAACSMVEIDTLSGEHQVLSTDIVMDVGKSLNPGIDVGQIEGAFLQGYGMVTLEEWKLNSSGEIECTGPNNYNLPYVGSLPNDFNVTLLSDCPKEQTVYSSKGIGEPPLLLAITVHKAIRSAVLASRKDKGLTEYVQLDCPVTSTKVLKVCSDSVLT